MVTVRINLNEPIRVKLTDYGKEIWEHKYDYFNDFIKKPDFLKPSPPNVDDEGYTKMQLHQFMHLYGPYLGIGSNKLPIQPLEIVFEAEGELYGEE